MPPLNTPGEEGRGRRREGEEGGGGGRGRREEGGGRGREEDYTGSLERNKESDINTLH